MHVDGLILCMPTSNNDWKITCVLAAKAARCPHAAVRSVGHEDVLGNDAGTGIKAASLEAYAHRWFCGVATDEQSATL